MSKNRDNIKTIIAVITISTIVAMLFSTLPIAYAPIVTRDSHLFISATPNPVGVGQSMQILCWANIYPSEVTGFSAFHNYTFTFKHPDNTIETKLMATTDPLGSAYFNYIPTDLGTYTVKCNWPGETVGNNSFSAQESKTITFEVQEEPIPDWSENPLPTGYWARPIDASNREWWSIGGNWFDFSQGQNYGYNYWTNFAPYTTAPNSAHILWTKVHAIGGLAGGESLRDDYYFGESYSMKFQPIILDGRLYYNMRRGTTARGFACVDLRTGEELYRQNDTTITGAMIYSRETMNDHGSYPFLVQISGSMKTFLDPLSGEVAFRIVNATATGGAIIMNNTAGPGKDSEMNEYILSGNRLICWSFNKCVGGSMSGNRTWANGIVYNVSIPKPVDSASYAIGTSGGIVDGKILVGRSVNASVWPPKLFLVGVRCSDGQILWTSNTTILENPGGWRGGGGVALSSDGGVYLNYQQETMQVVAWDLEDGSVKYTTTPRNDSGWGMYTSGWSIDSAYGKFYVGAYDGYIYAYDINTGDFLWKYSSGNAGTQTPYGTWPFFLGIPYGMTIADGKIFAATGEHSPNDPLYRGERLHVIDAETGEGVWSVQGWWCGNAIADGQYTAFNGYDGRIISFGKGPSATTVSAGPKSATIGDKVVIEGTVMDTSVGTKESTQVAMFPKGVPAIADKDESRFMEYLYMQQPLPTDAAGVEVTIDVFDSNGNYRNIGTTTSDMSGYFSFTWEPDIAGDFKVIATFAGSNSYYPSYSETAFTMTEAPLPPVEEPVQTPISETYFVPAVAGIIVVLIIGFALVAILLLRKRN